MIFIIILNSESSSNGDLSTSDCAFPQTGLPTWELNWIRSFSQMHLLLFLGQLVVKAYVCSQSYRIPVPWACSRECNLELNTPLSNLLANSDFWKQYLWKFPEKYAYYKFFWIPSNLPLEPWTRGSVRWNIIPCTKRSQVQLPMRHIPRLWVRSPFRARTRGMQSMFLSPFLSP